jgi:hypothetical protein
MSVYDKGKLFGQLPFQWLLVMLLVDYWGAKVAITKGNHPNIL